MRRLLLVGPTVHAASIDGGPTGGTGPSPHLDGYLSQTLNEFGEFGYTTERAQALRVTIDDRQGAPFDLLSSVCIQRYT